MSLEGIMLSEKKPVSQGHILCDSIYMTFWKGQNYSEREQISGCQGIGVGKILKYKGAA